MLKILDCFCGAGGWSEPFIEDGDDVTGIDIINYGYKGKFIQKDIREISGKDFQGYDLIIGSPPCNEFSIAKEIWKGTKNERNVEKGLELVREYERIIEEAKPKLWAMENVKNMLKWYPKEPKCIFRISKRGYRCLWANFDIQIPDFPDVVDKDIWRRFGWNTRYLRAKIPYEVARFVANRVKEIINKDEK